MSHDRDHNPAIPPPPSVPLPSDEGQVLSFLKNLERGIEDGFRTTKADIELLGEQVHSLGGRVSYLERRVSRGSERTKELARETSDHDLEHDAKIAQEIVARKKLETEVSNASEKAESADTKADLVLNEMKVQTEILRKLAMVLDKPLVKVVAAGLLVVLYRWLVARGIPLP